jgi:hypothetical protein
MPGDDECAAVARRPGMTSRASSAHRLPRARPSIAQWKTHSRFKERSAPVDVDAAGEGDLNAVSREVRLLPAGRVAECRPFRIVVA